MQRKIILSIGSNQGDRLENIAQCVTQINEQIGVVLAVSKVYETPAWGFESTPFYNCALIIHTSFSPNKVLKKIGIIENQLGRIRCLNTSTYQARLIDVDIIAYEEQIINTATITVPHIHMHNRKFVLQPMLDLRLDWVHPVLHKTVAQLYSECQDSSTCIEVAALAAPIDFQVFKEINYIAIEGNIGAGKTTLATKFSQDFNAKLVLERFADNPFLAKFYKDQNRYAFPLEMSFLVDRYKQLTDDLSQFDLFTDFVVTDYHIFKSLIFSKVTLQEDEYRLYKTLFDIVYKEMPKPNLYVYLYQNTDRLLENIKKRGRLYEQDIPATYLDRINKGYLDFIKTQLDLNVLIIDVSTYDFVKNQEDYVYIINQIKNQIAKQKG